MRRFWLVDGFGCRFGRVLRGEVRGDVGGKRGGARKEPRGEARGEAIAFSFFITRHPTPATERKGDTCERRTLRKKDPSFASQTTNSFAGFPRETSREGSR